MKINENEKKCLEVMLEHFDDYDGNYLYFRTFIPQTGLNLKQVKRAVRSLAKKGLAKYGRGLFNSEGEVAGSGYRATEEGKKLLERSE